MAKSNYAINIDDGRVVCRTVASDRLHALYRKISDDVAKAIFDGRVKAMDVVNAIMANERFSGVFDWKQFEREKRLLNIRTQDVDLADTIEEATEKLPEDKPGETISLAEIERLTGGAGDKPPKGGKKSVESLGLSDD